MSTDMTARELALQYADTAFDGSALGIEADVPLGGERLAVLKNLFASDKALGGLEVFGDDGASLGVVPRAALLAYILKQPSTLTRGGRIGQLEGSHVGEAPLFRCEAHQPPYQRLLWAGSPLLLKCKVCGQALQRVRA
jgi:hypothetical protein